MARLRDLESQVAHFMEPEQLTAVGERLRLARENSPFTQRELADAASVQLRTYQFWEQGRGVSRRGVDAIAKRLGVDPLDIWEGRPEEDRLAALDAQMVEMDGKLNQILDLRNPVLDRINERLTQMEENQQVFVEAEREVRQLMQALVGTAAELAGQVSSLEAKLAVLGSELSRLAASGPASTGRRPAAGG